MHHGIFESLSLVRFAIAVIAAIAMLSTAQPATANVITFESFANEPSSGIAYERAPTPAYMNALQQLRQDSRSTPVSLGDFISSPYSPHGQPGVVLFDHDNDGDLDIYVTNGPGANNSLYSNQLIDTGGNSVSWTSEPPLGQAR